MGADQTPDPTAWSDDQLDDLLDALAERAEQRDDLDLPGSSVSRRSVLATLLGAGGLGVGATQLGAAASWSSASGTLGTQSSPIDTGNVRDLDSKLLETELLSHNIGSANNVSGSRSLDTEFQNTTGAVLLVSVDLRVQASGDRFEAGIQTAPSSGLGNFSDSGVEIILRTADAADDRVTLTALVADGAFYGVKTFLDNDAKIRNWFERSYK